jgi:UDP-glucose 4-epimerase
MTRYLITGGAGFIGSHIAKKLVTSGQKDIIIFDDISVGNVQNIPDGCKGIIGDIRNRKEVDEAMNGVDVVFHEAAFVSIRGSFDKLQHEIDVNCTGMLNVLESAGAHGVKHVLFASSMAVYGEPQYQPVDENHPTIPISPYGLSKLRGEMYCKTLSEKYGYDITIFRYFNTFGIGQALSPYVGVTTIFINYMLNNEPITMLGDPTNTRDFVWVEDIADANVYAALNHITGTYNLGSGKETSIGEIANSVQQCFSRKDQEMIYNPAPKGDIKRICSDISKAKTDLNYSPKRDIIEDIPNIVSWWRKKAKSTI